MKKIIITNNRKVYEKYRDSFDLIFLDKASYTDVLYKTRDKVHGGCKILTHPMAGSLKPNQTPFKSIMLENSQIKAEYESITLIENSLEAAFKFLKHKSTPEWNEKILNDFRTIDLSLIEGVVNNSMKSRV